MIKNIITYDVCFMLKTGLLKQSLIPGIFAMEQRFNKCELL